LFIKNCIHTLEGCLKLTNAKSTPENMWKEE